MHPLPAAACLYDGGQQSFLCSIYKRVSSKLPFITKSRGSKDRWEGGVATLRTQRGVGYNAEPIANELLPLPRAARRGKARSVCRKAPRRAVEVPYDIRLPRSLRFAFSPSELELSFSWQGDVIEVVPILINLSAVLPLKATLKHRIFAPAYRSQVHSFW